MKKTAIILLCILIVGVIGFESFTGIYRICNSFNAGELTDLLSAREDLSKYQSGCSLMENFFPIPQGGAQKRPGTEYIATVKDANYAVRLLPFEYSIEQSYVVEAGNGYMRFFHTTDGNSGILLTGSGTEDLTALDNIISHWLFNGINATTVIDDEGNHNGTASAELLLMRATGYIGAGCFDFDGQYSISIADHADFSFTDDSSDSAFSVTGWVYVTDTAATQTIASKWKKDTYQEWRLALTEDGKLKLELCNQGEIGTDVNDANCIARWKLDDNAASTVVIDAIGDYNGISSTNTSNIATTGTIDGAFDFNNLYNATVADNDVFSFTTGTADKPFSISAWVYNNGDDAAQSIISKQGAGTTNYEWFMYMINQKVYLSLIDRDNTGWQERFTSSAISAGWHFVVVTYNGVGGSNANEGIEIYIDGAEVASTPSESGTYVIMRNRLGKVSIGSRYEAGTSYWRDKLDDIQIFNKTLSLSEVISLYSGGEGGVASVSVSATSNDSIDLGWHFIAATYSAPYTYEANGILLYVDGASVGATYVNDVCYVSMQNTAADVTLGAQVSASGVSQYIFADKMDDMAVFSDVLTPAEVESLLTFVPYEISTPYEANDSFGLRYSQSADVLFFANPDYAPMKLSRYSENVWELAEMDFSNGPFLDENITSTTITPSATTGGVTLTASSSLFSSTDVGGLWQLVYTDAAEEVSGTFTASDQNSITVNVYKGRDYKFTTTGTWAGTMMLQRSYDNGTTWKDIPGSVINSVVVGGSNIAFTGTEEDGDATYRVYMKTYVSATPVYDLVALSYDVLGVVKITSCISGTVASGIVKKTLGGTSATTKWSEAAWSERRGYPKTIAFFGDRLYFGGNSYKPDTVWGSVVGDYNNMQAGSEDADAVAFTLSSKQVNAIQWMVGKNKLLIGTSGAEWTLSGGTDEPITPSNVKAEQQSPYGNADLQAELANESVLFFQRGSKKMRELTYNWELESYIAPDMTLLAKDIAGDGIVDMAFQQIPDSILWCIRSDGEIATFSYERKEEITSWARQVTNGDFESVATIHGDPEDEVWVTTKRTVDSNSVRYIEKFRQRDFGSDANSAYFVDCGKTYTVDVNEVNDLDWLEGESVFVLADGNILEANSVAHTLFDVNDGTITLGGTYNRVQIGLPYTAQLRTMPLSWLASGSTVMGRIKRINGVAAQWHESGDFYIGRDLAHKELYPIARMTTNESDLRTFPAGYDKPGYVLVYQYSPEPLTLLSLLIEFGVY